MKNVLFGVKKGEHTVNKKPLFLDFACGLMLFISLILWSTQTAAENSSGTLVFESSSTSVEPPAIQTWQVEEEHSNYKIYRAEVSNSKFDATKAEITLPINFQQTLKLFPLKNACWSWINRCKMSKTLRELSEHQSIVYTTVNMPWPLSDREFVFLTKINEQKAQASLQFIPSELRVELPQNKKYVRGFGHTSYTISQINQAQTKIEILMHTDFGGNVSAGLINSKLVNELEKDVKSLIAASKQLN